MFWVTKNFPVRTFLLSLRFGDKWAFSSPAETSGLSCSPGSSPPQTQGDTWCAAVGRYTILLLQNMKYVNIYPCFTVQGWGQKTEMSLVVYFVYFEQRSLCGAKLGTMLQTPSISNFDHHLRFAFLANFWQVLKL